MEDKVKPTDIDIANIANAYCRLQMGVEQCGECTGYKNGFCGWLREKIIPITAVRFAIEAWNKRSQDMKLLYLLPIGFVLGIGFAMGCAVVECVQFWIRKAGEISGKTLASYFNKRSQYGNR